MSSRRVRIVLICEDTQHEAFVRRFLLGMGWETREMRVEKSPNGEGSGEQWVRETFPVELEAHRQKSARAASALLAVIDADTRSVEERQQELKHECEQQLVQFRRGDESVAIVVPKRSIETWIRFLEGEAANEAEAYPKLQRERKCKPAVDRLLELCRTTGLPNTAPNSLVVACSEYAQRIRPMKE